MNTTERFSAVFRRAPDDDGCVAYRVGQQGGQQLGSHQRPIDKGLQLHFSRAGLAVGDAQVMEVAGRGHGSDRQKIRAQPNQSV